ncbi:MAG: ABC-2 family transporter protein [Deltaproteobacteria bacterium]|nr:ABC-2 family transporter protein [Deltaproteobacteria bacterium]
MSANAFVQHLRIAGQYARIGVIRKSQFRVEFWSQVVMDCCWYASHVAVFEVLYAHVDDIAGWNREQFRVLLGFLFVSDAFMMVWLGQMWRFWRDLKDGKLDSFRVRPGATLFLYGFQQFSVEGCVNMAVAMTYLAYGIGRACEHVTLGLVLVTLIAVAVSWWVRTILVTFYGLVDLWLLGSDAGQFVNEAIHAVADRPADVFGARVRTFLLYILPVGALTQVPAGMVLGRYTPLGAVVAVGWLGMLGVGMFAAWNRGFRRYESAMG